MGPGLKTFSEKWGLKPMSWEPPFKLTRDVGLHYQLPRPMRIEIYKEIKRMIHETWPSRIRPELSLCKEISEVRKASGITSRRCNCE